MRSFLAASKLASKNAAALHLFVGNEACDADSIVSAIVGAYHASTAQASPTSRAPVPVLCCTRRAFEQRREAVWLLETALAAEGGGEWRSDLVFLDELLGAGRVPSLAREGLIGVTLVDHNELKGPLKAALGGREVVEAVIDHHADSGAHPTLVGLRRRIAWEGGARGSGIASTCTLLAQDVLARHAPPPPSVALALLGVILVDSVGLEAAAGKVTPHDAMAAAALFPLADSAWPCAADSGAALFRVLGGLKSDPAWWASLPPSEALSYDYKSFACGAGREFGSSSLLHVVDTLGGCPVGEGPEVVPVSVETAEALLALLGGPAPPLAFILLLSARMEGGSSGERHMRRQLAMAWTGEGDDIAPRVLAALEDSPLDLRPRPHALPSSSPLHLRVWEQGNTRASRKQVVPLILAALA
jgi:exopolyphosphatase